ncbi:MAG: S-methyl-5-thioribose-1-phosphate isomerase [bacterium]|nr:S-methyl-5-thioribose-1-phosphate isomerase [bacterium]
MKLNFSTISWENGIVKILDQTLLPNEETYKIIRTPSEMAEAIRSLRVRGAPLIGIAAAYGVALAAKNTNKKEEINSAIKLLESTRPTAYNLFYSLNRVKKVLSKTTDLQAFIEEADKLKNEDEETCFKIGKYGVSLIPQNARCMTHCNAGALATAGIGTALAPLYLAKDKISNVFVPETRPVLQGARLTAWELTHNNIPATLICDSARGYVLSKGMVDLCIVGADRITRNGDTANKIGTYALAVLAKTNNVPFYVAAPYGTIDTSILSGDKICIELRGEDEVKKIKGVEIAPKEIKALNPAFDVTPAEYITAFITENGIQKPPFIPNH